MSDEQDDNASADIPSHSQAATTAGLQFVLGIGLVLAVVIPALFVYFVLIPMGWNAIIPGIIFVIALGCIAYITRVISRSNQK